MSVPNTFIKTSNEETIFCTGLFYSLLHKELGAPVTYLPAAVAPPANTGEADNIVVVRKGPAYLRDGKDANSTLFAFLKDSDFYKLFHKELLAPVTYNPATNAPVGEGQPDNLLVVRNHSHSGYRDYQPGGQWENSTLFSIVKHGDFYKLFHKELDAAVTYMPHANAPAPRSGEKDDILVVRNISHVDHASYVPGGRWENSTLFSFVPERYRLTALITDLKVSSCGKSSLITTPHKTRVWSVRNESFSEAEVHHVKVARVLENVTTWAFSDTEERTFFLQEDIEVNVSAQPYDISDCLGTETVNAGTSVLGGDPVRWSSLSERKTVVSSRSTITADVEVRVLPRHSTEYLLGWEKVEVRGIPFAASVIVSAVADRLQLDGSVKEMAPVDANGVLALMLARGYKGVVRTEGGNVVTNISGMVDVSGMKMGTVTHYDNPLDVIQVNDH